MYDTAKFQIFCLREKFKIDNEKERRGGEFCCVEWWIINSYPVLNTMLTILDYLSEELGWYSQ